MVCLAADREDNAFPFALALLDLRSVKYLLVRTNHTLVRDLRLLTRAWGSFQGLC